MAQIATEEDTKQDEDLEEPEFLKTSEKLIINDPHVLRTTHLHITRMKDANIQERSKAVIQSVEFHNNGQLLYTAGLDKTLRLFQIDGVRNPKVQSIFFPDLPIVCAHFNAQGSEIICSGRRQFFYVYDVVQGSVIKVPNIKGRSEKSLESFSVSPDNKHISFVGNSGNIILVSQATKQWIGNMKINGIATACKFSPSGQELFVTGSDGIVYIWDVRMRACLAQHVDDGCLNARAISVSSNGKYYATGADSGVVNMYSSEGISSLTPNMLTSTIPLYKPLKSFMNLTTPADQILFNHDTQLLAIASSKKKDSLKMVHIPSWTVYQNWPSNKQSLGIVSSMAFSPNSGYFAIGNDQGDVLLHRLNHFQAV